jgi:two-component system, NtrC family, sensor kinase
VTADASTDATTGIEWLTELLRLSQGGNGGRQQAVDAMLAHVVRGFGGASGCLAIRPVNPTDEGVRIAAAIDLPPEVIGRRIMPGQGVLGSVLQGGEPLLLNGDLRQDHRFAHLPAEAPSRRASSALCWPLKVEGDCIGVVSINRPAGQEPFDAGSLARGGEVVALLALVVDNWRTHDDLQARVEHLRTMNEEVQAMNRRLAETQHQLLQAAKMASIGQLAAGVAHEINNPIGYVSSNLCTLHGYVKDLFTLLGSSAATAAAPGSGVDVDFLREDTVALLDECDAGLARVKKIVQDLKDFSRIDQTQDWADADLAECLASTLNIVHNEIKYKAMVVKELQPLPAVPCIASQISQVLLNLLVNAGQAIEGDGRITLRSGHNAAEAWLEVQDNGCGIPPDQLDRIFDPFFTTKPVGQGTGLGLSLSYSILRKHHGRLEVRSEVGVGSCFRVVLPLRQPDGAQP